MTLLCAVLHRYKNDLDTLKYTSKVIDTISIILKTSFKLPYDKNLKHMMIFIILLHIIITFLYSLRHVTQQEI